MDFSEKEIACIKGKNSFLCSRLLHEEEHFKFPIGTSDFKKNETSQPQKFISSFLLGSKPQGIKESTCFIKKLFYNTTKKKPLQPFLLK